MEGDGMNAKFIGELVYQEIFVHIASGFASTKIIWDVFAVHEICFYQQFALKFCFLKYFL